MTEKALHLRIVVLAPLRYPIRQPFAGGLETAIWNEVRHLRARGHAVTLVGVEGSDYLDGGPSQFVLPAVKWAPGSHPDDVAYPDGYLQRALSRLQRALDHIQLHHDQFDVISNHCLHSLPLERASELGVPMITTLHTPVISELVTAHRESREPRSQFVAVSNHTATEWKKVQISATVLPNALEGTDWSLGTGGDRLIWFGRLVPEKGAHLAIDTARLLGRPIDIVGRIGDRHYADSEILPRLSTDTRLLGEVDHQELGRLIRSSACALVTPVWQEPFGLVAAEALACGTPVAAFHSGGIAEIAARTRGIETAPIGDTAALAEVAERLIQVSHDEPGYRKSIRDRALEVFSLSRRSLELEGLFCRIAAPEREAVDDAA